ncbi:MAG TPA: ABC transporter substrate-binding protein [Amaricoccus sp.]|uniref:ABC transporter substrate-binding protein n=1 Tax=Amaricoccus sp. TaxID=1872485 RepID=UPI001D639FE7|nr:ABC transporter substrate-binding protein [Amaricoccus sp.]MCB1372672.1 ABC transporter substrate-binding protein [Paracoccaceae bacterium]MCC0065827.1 ABC transporter substrate-binding protein [Rhodovulum sp.]MCB1401488.1 ABC transporter substrate-binding protein [Paracoccaceae bacterium]HPG21683.1 ABC transporter substrate-binding protein [Amaricoccus sp.]HRW14426.1 ABC transporter substrate-binding protein [Amaricoccus sp.]
MLTAPSLQMSRRGLLAMAGVGLATAALPAQLFAQSGNNILIIASGQDIPNFDPHTATGYSASFFLRNVYDPLVRVSGNPPEPVPGLAESWTVSEDGKGYTFKLNPAAVFHSGNPVTADDVVFSFQRALALAEGNSWMIRDIVTPEGVTAVDPQTVQFDLAVPFAPFLQVLPWIFIVEKAAVEANEGGDSGKTWLMTNTAGSGPFNVSRFQVGTLYHLARAEDAWQPGGGNLDGVIWQIVRETATQRLMLQRGEAHIAVDLTSEDMDALQDAPSVVRIIEPEYRTFSIKMNTEKGPCADVNLRKAISYATNYQAILDAAGYADLMTGPLPIGILGFNPDLEVPRTDLDKAREYLAKSAQPEGGFTLKMVHVSGLEQQRRWALIMLDSLKQLNIGLDIQPLNWPDMVALCQSPETFPDLFPVYQTANYGDPDNIAFAAYHSSRNGSWQNPVYRNPEVDALIEAGRSEIDTDKRVAIYGAFQEKVVADAPDIFGVLERRKLGMRDSVQNYSFTPVASNAIEAWPLSLG